MSVSKALIIFMRAAMAVQIILGIGFWTGRWYGLVNLHMAIGVLFVLSLWVIAARGIAQQKGLAAFAFLWGVVVVALGMTQQQILVGDLHWIIRIVHLVIGIASMPIAEKLAAAPSAVVPARTRASM